MKHLTNLTNKYAHTAVTPKVVTQKKAFIYINHLFYSQQHSYDQTPSSTFYAVQYENKEWGNKTIHSKLRKKNRRWYMIHTTRAIVGQHASQPIKLLHFHRIWHGVKQNKFKSLDCLRMKEQDIKLSNGQSVWGKKITQTISLAHT